MTDDEAVDGPKAAAAILARMKPAQKDRIVKAIHASDPNVAEKIEQNLFNFDDIAELTTQGIQTLLQSIDQRDLILSLKTAKDKVKEIIFKNVSDRKKQMIEEELEAIGTVRLSEVEDAQRRILDKLDELRTAGKIRTESSKDLWV